MISDAMHQALVKGIYQGIHFFDKGDKHEN